MYKQGQAGITKATVSIVFNNENKQNSPVGFDHDDKITVTRQVFAAPVSIHQNSSSPMICAQQAKIDVLQLVIGGRNKYLINGHNAQPRYAGGVAATMLVVAQ